MVYVQLCSMFIATLFTITKIWKQPKYTLTDEQVNKCGMYTQCIVAQLYKH